MSLTLWAWRCRGTWMRHLSGARSPTNWQKMKDKTNQIEQKAKTMIKEEMRDIFDANKLNTFAKTSGFITQERATVFPRIKTTSLSTKRIVIQDEAKKADATILNIAFRQSGMEQILEWHNLLASRMPRPKYRDLHLIVNETFLFRALSGFIQSSQRRKIPVEQHDQHIVYNNSADGILALTNSSSRVVGYLFLLDREAKLRWYGYCKPTEESVNELADSINKLAEETKKEEHRSKVLMD
eukprot:Plantae.Rhodophyta-Purpureofilum_apyrenoidigerum.ctg4191.p1 GENE.Plantae.Rhodophyta-Purpureofilum_apyrenoidigerum.ctg4191~~Plantae.Rhodophyta-Purpureofilum_apyrenoidigerum.ctg4191.p1  ORF type:complete len:240 (+),score=37.73 Plantae.Rhodophyta-Purpureofilum_apyrenoidigerum.ctg4191:291-1010(+)